MQLDGPGANGDRVQRVGYVVKRYPRYSETFIVNEILAHEAAGLELSIFALRPSNDTHFQNRISQVRAAVDFLPAQSVRAGVFWKTMEEAREVLPGFWDALATVGPVSGDTLHQAIHLALAVRRLGIGHLHAHFATLATSVTRVAARLAGIPFTFTAHAKDIFHETVDPEDLERKLVAAKAVVTVSDFNRGHLREKFGAAAARVERIYNGLDLDAFPYQSPYERPLTIVGVGRLVEKKGFADLIDACAKLVERGREFRCEIIGSGDQQADLRARIERLNLAQRVELVGSLPQSEVTRRLHQSAVLAAPCVVGKDGNRDGLPTVLLEAMALGTPCVSTYVTGIPEVVRDGDTGLLVPPENSAALATALERLLADADLRVRLAINARSLIEQDFNVQRSTARLRRLFGADSAAGGVRPARAVAEQQVQVAR